MLKKILLSILLIYTLFGFFILPLILKSKSVEIVNQQTNSKLYIEGVYFNPLIFKLELSGLELKSLDDKHLVSFSSLEINLEPLSLFRAALHVKQIILNKPKVSLVYNEDKTFNLAKIAKPSEKEEDVADETKTEMPRVIVGLISIEDGSVDYEDFTTAKKFDFSIGDVDVKLQDIDTNDFDSSGANFRFHSNLGDGGAIDIKTDITGFKPLKLEGSVNFQASKLYTQWRYIQDKLGIEVADGKLSFAAKYFVNFDDLDSTLINVQNISLQRLRLKPKDKPKDVLNLKSLNVNNVSVKPMQKNVHVENITLDSLHVKVKRDQEGNIDWNELFKSKENDVKEVKQDTNTTSGTPWNVVLDSVSLKKSMVGFMDESIENKANINLDNININAYNIDLKENSWIKYDASIRVNKGGIISSKGSFSQTPLKQKGSFSIKKLSLKEFTPYIQESIFAKIDDGYLNLNSEVSYSKNNKKPDLHVDGRFNIQKFKLSDSRDAHLLLSFKKTELKSIDLKMFPNSLYVNEVNLDSFYVDAKIDEQKVLNFAKLSKVKSDENITKTEDTNSSNKEEKTEFPMKIMKLNVSNGKANFSDFSLPIKFKTSIHDLNGYVYAISNSKGEISYIDIDGIVDKYGSTKLKGSIEPSNIKSYTDIEFNFRNLGLDSYSGYSAQFAGHKIEKGKLFLDLGYKIFDSQLLGKNSIIIKKIELGDEIDDENITKLPLGFALALLEDSDGVIDIDMPVEGNIDAPDFKYGALVLKTLGNLIIKAVASPFNFLGAALGINGDDLKYAEFEAAEFNVLPPEREKLDNIAKILVKKPKLSLAIIGSYDAKKDTEALKLKKLTQEIIKRSSEKGHKNNTVILEEIYTKLSSKESLKALREKFEKMYKKEEVFDVEYQKELFLRDTQSQIVSIDELKVLANSRALQLKDYLVQSKNIQEKRVILHEIQEVQNSDDNWVKTALKIEVK